MKEIGARTPRPCMVNGMLKYVLPGVCTLCMGLAAFTIECYDCDYIPTILEGKHACLIGCCCYDGVRV